ncbi:MAG: hypothetical protein IT370_22800 [Deltaproteobacteria bacterium]|nr:hypothetical protein [Deltaproteobacteria bacterium]
MFRFLPALLLLATVSTGCEKKQSPDAGERYIRRSKSIEAQVNLQQIYRRVKTFWEVELRLPPAAPLRPAAGSCCRQPGQQCPPEAAPPPWDELGDPFVEAHRYSYEFIPGPDGPNASFKVRAVGDLDCDGTLSTYELSVTAKDGVMSEPVLSADNPLD